MEKYNYENKDQEHFKLLLVIPYLKSGKIYEAKEIYKQIKENYMWYIYGLKEIIDSNLSKEELQKIEG